MYLRLDDPGNGQSISKNISALVRRHRSALQRAATACPLTAGGPYRVGPDCG
jgi:hypothetical protein